MRDHYYAVIMAGGGGTRLWPLSRKTRPKQMLALFDEHTLFQTSVNRLAGVFSPQKIFVVTVADQAEQLHQQCPEIPAENFILEPMARGTASVIGLASVAIQQIDPQAVIAVLASDHFIKNEDLFRQLILTAGAAAQEGYLVTLGIEPSFPATGFGYIQKGEPVGEEPDLPIFRVEKFKEKPSQEQARLMIADRQHFWNSGMFFWQAERILAEIQRQMPKLASGLAEIEKNWNTPQAEATIERIWQKLHPETIDYGVMEGARDVVVLPAAGLGWNDVGSWDSLFDVLDGDEHGNIIMGGEHVGLDTANSLVYMNQPHRLIVTIGVSNLVVVDTGDVLLVCEKDQAQQVRQVVEWLKEKGKAYL